jgi:hypothetical protein
MPDDMIKMQYIKYGVSSLKACLSVCNADLGAMVNLASG